MPPKKSKSRIGGDSNPLADDAEHTDPVSPLHDQPYERADEQPSDAAAAAGRASAPATGEQAVERVVERIGEVEKVVLRPPTTPQEMIEYLDSFTPLDAPLATTADLTPDEQQIREQYESATVGVDLGFIVEGMVAKWTRDGELYRDECTKFEDYCQARDRSIRRTNQLIQVAPLGQHLLRRLGNIFSRLRLNESQTRHLLPLAERAGNDAAVLVYETLLQADERVTGRLLDAVLATLPDDHWDPDEAVGLIKAFLAQDARVLPADTDQANPDGPVEAEIGRIQKTARRATRLAHHHPDLARRIATELEQAAQQIRAELGN